MCKPMHQRCVIVKLWVDSCGFIEVMQVHSLLCVYSACTSPAHSSRWANPNRPTDLARLYALRERRIQPPVQRTVQVGCSSGKHQKTTLGRALKAAARRPVQNPKNRKQNLSHVLYSPLFDAASGTLVPIRSTAPSAKAQHPSPNALATTK